MAKKPAPEDAFYDNLTLGLIKTLANMPRVCNVSCEKRQPCDKAQVVNWEQRHGVYLPEDMKKFYLSTDGFLLQWSYQYSPSDIRRVGYIQFPHLMQITLLRENLDSTLLTQLTEQPNTSAPLSSAAPSKDRWGHDTPVLTPKSKIFEINNINDVAKVCMVYESTVSIYPHIFLLELDSFKWQFLAETFSEYLRMSIGHLGLPFWELCFASCGLPSWTEQLFLLLAPHLLEEHEPRRSRIINPVPEHPSNVIDPTIFRAKPKGSTKLSAAGKHK